MHRELGMMPERRVSKIIGKDVRTSDNQSLGEIDDLVLDVGTGQVAFVVVGFGGVAGLGEKVALVPLSAIEPRRDFVLVNADRQKIESMAFEEGNFPDLTDRQYTMRVYQSYGVQPYWEVYGYQGEAAGARGVSAWTPGSDYLKKFDAGSVKTIEGTIESVGTFRPAPDAMEGLRLRVRTADGLISVHAGPAGFIERHDVSLNVGDKVRITGAKTDFSGRPVILASAICLGDKSVVLREKDGTPAWKVEDLSVGGRPMERRMTPAQPERTAPRTVEPAPSTPPAPSTY
jgi:sporulation protein YlmC with PRC-barrel domain